MTAQAPEYKCKVCGHTFDVLKDATLSLSKDGDYEEAVRCPRCGSDQVERNPYLFGSPDAELTPEDYFAAAMQL